MIGRETQEWVGANPDAAIPARVKLRIWERCGGRCALTGRKLMVGEPHDYDHIIPLGLGGEHRETNIQLVGRDAHRKKTADDTRAIRKAKRIALKHIGAWPKSKRPLKSRGFEKTRSTDSTRDGA